MTSKVAAIIPAAGSGTRMKSNHPKQYHSLGDAPILVHTVRAFVRHPAIDQTVVAVPAEWLEKTEHLLAEHGLNCPSLIVTAGGRRRQDSVFNGLEALDDDIEIVLVHDGARPLLSSELIDRCCQAVEQHGAAIAAVPVKDTLKRGGDGNLVTDTVDREGLWQAQTPQAATLALLRKGYQAAAGQDVTDESMLLEHAGIPVTLVMGEETNLKITRPEDLALAEIIMQRSLQNDNPSPDAPEGAAACRIGHGFDAHRLVEGRKLVLGGIEIDYELGLAGHSDADVLTHALCDAILGALGAGDIGSHFPDSDGAFKDIYSIKLLDRTIELARKKGYRIGNADITVVCQKPKLAPHIPRMKEVLAKSCQAPEDAINLKATTTEKMGYTGRGEGISCHAVVLLTSAN
ncbi:MULTISPECIES: 2-C-methyl-D-erythritol 4-phosphate cytidylyltransferase [Desulfosediminicola]|uniref:2-C-methyl-D-erythritol 4-phosphate cytidylyltransferase n=1 Tax=Desulfosediminicola TaxID=2886823 RepID=UPI0010ADA411|nr:2-C-methyl-D-erythritol 4-phosphate cytidylyltransferase [Desulfosediminicola ganghwensis]